ncbi:sulfotransferase family 2 domain-containing protein [Algoriphagus machipongonensis]|uniref:Sulfotransferase family protein n=1 Tax=Algoriphagus machipongonensis TaxID=388413 RepID=A3HRR1_9BACT|nr:sulfotransferase family 2 domain-containing protein [Algoriphagus machipongonensis]EAZ82529.1 hypothetical protein ALPR1_09950 [Algoriphagus machipongonensis]
MISHFHKCVFVHIPKTAGISIEKKILESLDVKYENRMPFWLGPNNNLNIGPPRFAHLSYDDMIKYHYLSNEIVEKYYKFSIVRHPLDRLRSIYNYKGYNYLCSFNDFVIKAVPRLVEENWFFQSQVHFIRNSMGQIPMDFIGKFENLENDFQIISEKIGLSDKKLPHYNKAKKKVTLISKQIKLARLYKSDKKSFNLLSLNRSNIDITDTVKNCVYKAYREDFKMFDYNL